MAVKGVHVLGDATLSAPAMPKSASMANQHAKVCAAAVIALIMLVGGRIVPSFTNNWLTRNNPGRLPIPFSRFDAVTMVAGAVTLIGWIAAPAHPITGVLMLLCALLQSGRLGRWAGDRTLADRLVLVLHVAYAFVPLGFLLIGASIWSSEVPASAGIHAWTTGAVGLMTLAVMTRASLGHTGRPLAASPATQAIYALALAAAVLRVIAACIGSTALLEWGSFAWIAAFGGFVAVYGPLLITRRPSWQEPG